MPVPGRPETIEERLTKAGGATRGFDYLRLILAASVIVWHSLEVSYGPAGSVPVWNHARSVIGLILPMFFALSGFLVCGSLVRTPSIVVFMAHRFLRLIPALCVEILLSALLLGPVLTTLPLKTYLEGHEFRLYFLNIAGNIHYHLPGVFLSNPTSGIVNRSLWTIPYELECYLALVLLSVTKLVKSRSLMVLIVAAASVGFTASSNLQHAAVLASVGPPGRLLVLSFLAGVTLYMWRDKIPLHAGLFAGCLLLTVLLLASGRTMFLSAAPIAYVTAYLGLTRPRPIPVLMQGDYSYGLYLFAYPLQQTYALLFPGARTWWLDSLFALVAGLAYAFFSWNVVEKRVLSHRKRITQIVARALQAPVRLGTALMGRRSKGTSDHTAETLR